MLRIDPRETICGDYQSCRTGSGSVEMSEYGVDDGCALDVKHGKDLLVRMAVGAAAGIVLHTVSGWRKSDSSSVLKCVQPHSTAVYCAAIYCGFRKGAGGNFFESPWQCGGQGFEPPSSPP